MPSGLCGKILRIQEKGTCWEKYAVAWDETVLGEEVVKVLEEIIIKKAKKGHDWCLSFIFTLPSCCTEVRCLIFYPRNGSFRDIWKDHCKL